MDLHSQLAKGMDDIAKMVEERMNRFDKALAQQSGAKPTGNVNNFNDLASLAADYADFKSMVCNSLSMLQQQLKLLLLGFDNHEADSRRKILLFHGIPEDNSEQLDNKIISILRDQLKLTSVDHMCVDVCHRLGMKKDKPRPILVRFTGLKSRNAVWISKTALKGSGITISEFLTKPRQEVFISARKHFGLRSCWTADGTIIIALPDKTRAKIVSMSELDLLRVKYPSVLQSSQEQKTTRVRRNVKTLAK
ncbi:protein unc-13 homolog C-like [Pararge aegeria]|uniref:protein unc-13 homolog C-like n=1 Tax=Pararge aegeria TaxID=116150 RepID=UPI0019CFD867|nr:protein unc-13 homolog C-like [Pararge aegeria]